MWLEWHDEGAVGVGGDTEVVGGGWPMQVEGKIWFLL